jgi:hypothetical protein
MSLGSRVQRSYSDAARLALALPLLFGSISLASLTFSTNAVPRVVQAASQPAPQSAISSRDVEGRTRIAEGEYKVYTQSDEGAVGPFAVGVYNFTESWTLYRLANGTFEAEGKRVYESPKYEQHDNPFSVHLAADFRILGVKEYRALRWRPDSGPLSCDFKPAEIVCDSGAHNAAQDVTLDLPVQHPYGFLWPISAFSLSNITRYANRAVGKITPVEMLKVDEPSQDVPVRTSVVDGDLVYLGRQKIRVAGRWWQAEEFELKVAMHAPFLIWTSTQGLLLDFTEENNQYRVTERGMRLASYSEFPPSAN